MRIQRLLALSLSATLGAAAGACGLDFPPVIWSGEHLDYATDRDDTLCAGTFHLQDRFIPALADYLGIRLRNRDRILYAFVDPEEIGEFCPTTTAIGCARRRSVVARTPFHRHELVHSVTKIGGWYGPIPFDEGLADALGDGVGGGERQPVLEVLETFAYSEDDYYTMALFVRFLLDRHGVAPFAGFMREAKREALPADYAASFRAHFGESLQAASIAFEGYPPCSLWRNRIALLECAEATPWVDGRVTMHFDVRCDNPEVQGPYGRASKIVGYRAFDVEEEGRYQIVGSSELKLGMALSRCGSCVDPPHPYTFVTNNQSHFNLSPGRYFLAFEGTEEEEAAIDVVIRRVDEV